jgi:hypothetical protein
LVRLWVTFPLPPILVFSNNKNMVFVSKVVTFDIKLGDVPTESMNAYVFPLDKPDIVLGMGWLDKHNPLPDWKMKTWEFTRNGRRYQLNPTRRIPTFRVEPASDRLDSNTDAKDGDESTCIQLMDSAARIGIQSPPKASTSAPSSSRPARERLRVPKHRPRPPTSPTI